MKPILVEIGVGELIDKMTILAIKQERLTDKKQLENVTKEFVALCKCGDDIPWDTETSMFARELRNVNERLWSIEDRLRELEAIKSFSQEFIDLARSVYILNDERAALKKQINTLCGSNLTEEKSYTQYLNEGDSLTPPLKDGPLYR